MLNSHPAGGDALHHLTELVHELLDAHEDTSRLVDADLAASEPWRAHLDYLRGLQRVGREILAEVDRSAVADQSQTPARPRTPTGGETRPVLEP